MGGDVVVSFEATLSLPDIIRESYLRTTRNEMLPLMTATRSLIATPDVPSSR